MKKIKIKCVDFWQNAEKDLAVFWDILRQRYELDFCEEPDYLFYSCFGTEHLRYSQCIKICILWENLTPDFNLCDYGIAFDKIQFGDRYLRYPYAMRFLNRPELYNRQNRDAQKEHRDRFCSFVYSNAEADPHREALLDTVQKYKPVDCGGKIRHNTDIPMQPGWDYAQARTEFEKHYKFSIACENSSTPGYMTEKLFISLAAGTIPIYWGDPTIREFVNEKAFICAQSFATEEELLARIREVDTDPAVYQDMITQPVFLPGWTLEAEQEKLRDFLFAIFDQPKAEAYRRNMAYYGKLYQRRMLGHVENEAAWLAWCKKRSENPLFNAAKKVQNILKH